MHSHVCFKGTVGGPEVSFSPPVAPEAQFLTLRRPPHSKLDIVHLGSWGKGEVVVGSQLDKGKEVALGYV